jgi:hypothetical protein
MEELSSLKPEVWSFYLLVLFLSFIAVLTILRELGKACQI